MSEQEQNNELKKQSSASQTQASAENKPSKKQKEKKSIARRIWKGVMWFFISLLILIVLIPILIYLPPIQRFAIDKASEILSEKTGMDISVKEFSLGFPLDLEMGGVLAVQDGDTVVNAKSLDISVQLLPLFSSKVVVDKVQLDDIDLNTKSLIDALSVKGHVGTLSLNADNIDLNKEYAVINKILLKNTDLTIALADSVPEDTTVSEPTKWKFQLDDIQTENVKFTLALAPQADSTRVAANIRHGQFKGFIDMETSKYDFTKIQLDESSLAYKSGSDMDLNVGFDKMTLSANLDLEKAEYKLPAIQMDNSAIEMGVGKDMSLTVNSASTRLDGNINLETGLYKFDGIKMDEADIHMYQSPDMSLDVNSKEITLDGLLDMNTSIYNFNDIMLDSTAVALNQGNDLKLDVNLPKVSLDGKLNMETGVYDFNSINLHKPDIAIKQADGMTIDMSMQQASLDASLNINSSVYDFRGINLDQSKMKMKQGRDLDLELSTQKTALDGRLNLNTSDYDFRNVELKDSKVKMRQGNDMDLNVNMAKASLNTSMNLDRSDFKFTGVHMEQSKVDMRIGDGMTVHSDIGKGSLNGQLDLNKGNYTFSDIKLANSSVKYDADNKKPAKGFDTSHLAFNNMNTDIRSVQMNGDGSMKVDIAHMSGSERSGLQLQDASGTLSMNDKQLALDNFKVRTPSTNLTLDYAMDMNAFDTPSRGQRPGQFNIDLDGTVGKKDLALFMNDMYPEFEKNWPNQNLRIKTSAKGNMQQLDVKNFQAHMNGVMDIKGRLNGTSLTGDNMALNTQFDAKINDTRFIKSFLPADLQKEYNIPDKIDLVADATYSKDGVYAKANGYLGDTRVDIDGKVGLDSEDYDFAANISDFSLKDFMPHGENVELTGYVAARGHGFDPYAPTTTCNANLDLSRLKYDEYELHDINSTISLFKGDLDATLSVNDPNLITTMAINGTVKKENIDAQATIQLPHANLAAFGLYEGALEMATAGDFSLSTDMDHLLKAKANVDSLYLVLDDDTIHTPALDLFAETNNDSSMLNIKSGDMTVDFFSPENALTIVEKYQKTGEMAARFAKEHKLNLNFLKRHLPTANLKAELGEDNFVSNILQLKGISFKHIDTDFSTNPTDGIYGKANVKKFASDSLLVDMAKLNIRQDTTNITFDASIDLPDQARFDGFNAKLDGYVKMDEAKVMAKHYDKKGNMGLDFGMLVEMTDSAYIGHLLPEKPTLAYIKFKMNDDNFVLIDTLNRVFANVKLESQEDSCTIDIIADPKIADQDILAKVKNLDLKKVSRLLPNVSPLEGNIDITASYRQQDDMTHVLGNTAIHKFFYDGTKVGNLGAEFMYSPLEENMHQINAHLTHEELGVLNVDGIYDSSVEGGGIDANVNFTEFPLNMSAPFIPDQIFVLDGTLGGDLNVKGTMNQFLINGELLPDNMIANSDIYSLKLKFEDKPISFDDSRITFNNHEIYGAGTVPLTLSGWFDISDFNDMNMNLRLYGKGFNLIDAPRTKRSVLFGKMYGDFLTRVNGSFDDMHIRGLVNILPSTDMTYVMTNTPLSIDYRLSDIVTFVDFTQPPPDINNREKPTFNGIDMNLNLNIQKGAQLHCEFSADKQSYVNIEGEGALEMTYTPQGTLSLIGRYTIDKGDMKYTLPVIPLKDFTITPGSYIEFTGEPSNPTLNLSATEEMTATVNDNAGNRSVKFNTGLDVNGSLDKMELLFTIDAPEDMTVKNELASMSVEERNKLAVAMLCTGMYVSSTNSSGFDANNALNTFLEKEINNIAGKALNTMVDVDMGLEQTTRDDGTTRTDYSFKFSRRFFNNRLNVIIGGKVSSDGSDTERESGAYIDDVSLEWRLDEGGNRYVRLFHEKNYENLFEGELISNGISYIFRKKMDKFSDIWKPLSKLRQLIKKDE